MAPEDVETGLLALEYLLHNKAVSRRKYIPVLIIAAALIVGIAWYRNRPYVIEDYRGSLEYFILDGFDEGINYWPIELEVVNGRLGIRGLGGGRNDAQAYWHKRAILNLARRQKGLKVGNYRNLYYEIFLPARFADSSNPLVSVCPGVVIEATGDLSLAEERHLTGKNFSRQGDMIRARLSFPLKDMKLAPGAVIEKIHLMQTLREASKDAEFFYVGKLYLKP
jgi:hypothetical protein